MTTPFPPQGGVQAGLQSHLRAPCPGHGLHRHTQTSCFLPLTHETPYSPPIMLLSPGVGFIAPLFFAIHDSWPGHKGNLLTVPKLTNDRSQVWNLNKSKAYPFNPTKAHDSWKASGLFLSIKRNTKFLKIQSLIAYHMQDSVLSIHMIENSQILN